MHKDVELMHKDKEIQDNVRGQTKIDGSKETKSKIRSITNRSE